MIVINPEIMSSKLPDSAVGNLENRCSFHMEGRWETARMANSTGITSKGASYYSLEPEGFAQYTPYILRPGRYTISFWNIKYGADQNPVKMTGEVYANGETVRDIPLSVSEATVDRQGAWTKVGTYYFAGTNNEYFRLVAKGGAYSRPSDVKFEWADSGNHEREGEHNSEKAPAQLIQTTNGNSVLLYFHTPVIIYTKKEKITAEPETLILYKSASPCRFESNGKPLKFDKMEIQDDLTDLMKRTRLQYDMPYSLYKADFVTDIIQKIKYEMNQQITFKKEITDALVHELFFRIAKIHIIKERPVLTDTMHRRLIAVKNAIRENCQEKWTVELMAKKAYMSTPYFYILYKARFGVSPKKDLQNIRIEHAKQLLRQGSLSVKEIAGQIGYENEYYFIRKFKEQTGMTPGKYKKGLGV